MNALVQLSDMERMATAVAKSGLFGIKRPEQALALMLVAQAEGAHPATITQDYDIIQGRAARKTHSVLARFQAAGGAVEWHQLTDKIADATFRHAQGGALRITWTIEQARSAGLAAKDNWKNYPRAMLRARCIAEGVRAVYPAAIGGLLVAEEASDLPRSYAPAVDMGNAEVLPAGPSDDVLSAAQDAARHGKEAFRAYWKALPAETRESLRSEVSSLQMIAEEADRALIPAEVSQ